MSLLEKIRADQLVARKTKDVVATGLLTALLGEAARVGKTKANRESTDGEVFRTIQKFVKNAEETKAVIPPGEVLNKVIREISILSAYMPVQMTEQEIREAVQAYVVSMNAGTNIGAVMGYLRDNFLGRYDGKLASRVAKEVLG